MVVQEAFDISDNLVSVITHILAVLSPEGDIQTADHPSQPHAQISSRDLWYHKCKAPYFGFDPHPWLENRKQFLRILSLVAVEDYSIVTPLLYDMVELSLLYHRLNELNLDIGVRSCLSSKVLF